MRIFDWFKGRREPKTSSYRTVRHEPDADRMAAHARRAKGIADMNAEIAKAVTNTARPTSLAEVSTLGILRKDFVRQEVDRAVRIVEEAEANKAQLTETRQKLLVQAGMRLQEIDAKLRELDAVIEVEQARVGAYELKEATAEAAAKENAPTEGGINPQPKRDDQERISAALADIANLQEQYNGERKKENDVGQRQGGEEPGKEAGSAAAPKPGAGSGAGKGGGQPPVWPGANKTDPGRHPSRAHRRLAEGHMRDSSSTK